MSFIALCEVVLRFEMLLSVQFNGSSFVNLCAKKLLFFFFRWEKKLLLLFSSDLHLLDALSGRHVSRFFRVYFNLETSYEFICSSFFIFIFIFFFF